jgi:hypothetical protein
MLATTALAATPIAAPTAATGPARPVTDTTATLTGTINPNGQATTYHFEYGTTTTYGSVTADQTTEATESQTAASATVGSLTPGTTYHYRLLITSPAETKPGADRSFTTRAGISLAPAPGVITTGQQTTLSGQLIAANRAGVKVTLKADPAPFNAYELIPVATATTDATGRFTFSQAPTANTEYRVTADNPYAFSAIVTAMVRLRVALAVSTTNVKRGKSVTFRGSATPPRNGQVARIQKLVNGHWRTVKTTLLAASKDPQVSTFKTAIRVRARARYRAFVAGDARNLAGTSGGYTIRVH